MTTDEKRRYATVAEAAKYISVNPRTVRRMISEGTLTEYRAGNRIVRVDLNEMDQVMEASGEIMISCRDPECEHRATVLVPPGWAVTDDATYCPEHSTKALRRRDEED